MAFTNAGLTYILNSGLDDGVYDLVIRDGNTQIASAFADFGANVNGVSTTQNIEFSINQGVTIENIRLTERNDDSVVYWEKTGLDYDFSSAPGTLTLSLEFELTTALTTDLRNLIMDNGLSGEEFDVRVGRVSGGDLTADSITYGTAANQIIDYTEGNIEVSGFQQNDTANEIIISKGEGLNIVDYASFPISQTFSEEGTLVISSLEIGIGG